jgi:phospholipid/cholesterol/gamma-HCH transport system substrate-binding protein
MNTSNYVKIALFFIVIGVSGGAFIVAATSGLSDFSTRDYETVVEDATGLTTRSKVYLAGVAVGRIKKITLKNNEAVLRISFLKDIELRQDAALSRKASSILGTSILVLDPGNELSPIISPGGMINSAKSSGDMEAVMGTVQDLGAQISLLLADFQKNQLALLSVSLETFNALAAKINAQSDAELERISRILESTALITERVERMSARHEYSIDEPIGDITAILENIRLITQEIGGGRGNFGQAVFDDQVYASLLASMQQIEIAVEKLKDVLDSITTVAANANTVIDGANVIVDKAIGLNIQLDANGSYYALGNNAQASASLRLVPKTGGRWYRVGISSMPFGVSSRTVTETYDDNGNLSGYENATETRYGVVSIDAEIAQKLGIFTIRGGMYENTGGLGLDLQPWEWLALSGEVFNFQSEEKPNLRATVTMYPFFDPDSEKPWNWLYIKGGINDSLNDNRDYFVGTGVRFTDREIKGLVGILPVFNN